MAARSVAAAPASLLRGVRLGGSWQRALLLAPAIIILLAFLVAGIFADLLSAYDPEQIVLVERLIPPAFQDGGSLAHPLGTDNLGRDILARVMFGARVSLLVVVTCIPASALIGTLCGLLAGWRLGWWDRFLMRISIGYPAFDEEISVIDQQEQVHPIENLEAAATPADIIALQNACTDVYVDRAVREYIVGLTDATRHHRDVALGASPRASLGLFRAARAMAILKERDYVIPDDVKDLAVPVTAHRIILSPSARMRGVRTNDVVADLLNTVAVPGAAR